jgi:hypothetical protein
VAIECSYLNILGSSLSQYLCISSRELRHFDAALALWKDAIPTPFFQLLHSAKFKSLYILMKWSQKQPHYFFLEPQGVASFSLLE